ncbi:MAG: hypothetical protein U1B80_09830, partial [Anaerolineaceae bacterium]|nr:hypothetical protein [Anaerolineaceae bacterium]
CKLYQFLNGRGVPSITEALRELLLQRVQNPLLEIINPGYFQFLLSSRLRDLQTRLPDHLLPEAAEKMRRLLAGVQQQTGCAENWENILNNLETQLQAALTLPILAAQLKPPVSKPVKAAARDLTTFLSHDSNRWLVLFAWVFLHNLGKAAAAQDFERQTLSWLDEWQFGSAYAKLCQRLGLEETQTRQLTAALRVLISQQDWRRRLRGLTLRQMLEHWLSDTEVQRFLQINRFDDALWFNHEAFVEFTGWMAIASALDLPTHAGIQTAGYSDQLKVTREIMQKLLAAGQTSGYLVSQLLAAAED